MTAVPKVVELSDDGHELLSFIPGDVPAHPLPPWVWTDEALTSSVRLLRRFHDSTIGCDPSGPWRSPTHEPVEVICHNDFAPYNLVYRGGTVVGIIDFDYASPGSRLWDLAYLAYRIVPLSTDTSDGFTPRKRRERLTAVLDTYGSSASPTDLRKVVIQRLVELASLSDEMAVTLNNPELSTHAAMYRKDALPSSSEGFDTPVRPAASRRAVPLQISAPPPLQEPRDLQHRGALGASAAPVEEAVVPSNQWTDAPSGAKHSSWLPRRGERF